MTQKLAEEKGQAPAPKPVEREASKLQPKLQPLRTPGPGPSMPSPGVSYVNRSATGRQPQAKAAPGPTQDAGNQKQPPAPKKKLDDFRRDKDAADRQKDADRQQPSGRKTLDQYRPQEQGKDKGISR